MAGVEEVEVIAEAVPELVEHMETISRGFVALTAGVSALAGAVAGFIAAKKKLEKQYAEQAEEEISQMRDHFLKRAELHEKPDLEELKKVIDAGEYGEPTADVLADKVIEKHVDRLPAPVPIIERETPNHTAIEPEDSSGLPMAVHPSDPTGKSVFSDGSAAPTPPPTHEGWDYEAERARRSPDRPYVISVDEYGESGLTMTTFTYYAKDDVLCDERDKIVDNRDEIVGDENLDRFGHGSGDPNTVYIHNEALGMEVEINKSERAYAEEVAGLRHMDEAPHRRRRRDWDG